MFITIREGINETMAYEFGTPRASVKRAVRSKHYWAWRTSMYIVLVPSAVMLFFLVVSSFMSTPSGDRPEAVVEAEFFNFTLNLVPWGLLLIAGAIFSGISTEIRDVKRKVMHQQMRNSYVTDKDWSFAVMFPNGIAFDHWRPELIQVANEFFADPDVIEADRIIRQCLTKKKAVKEYHAKLKLIQLAQATYMNHRLSGTAVSEEFAQQRARLDKEMHPQLQEALDAFDVRRRSLQELVTRTQSSEVLR